MRKSAQSVETAPPGPIASAASPLRARDALMVFALALAMLWPFLGTRDVGDTAEGRPALVARDILATGRIRPPWLQGAPYLEKPPLYHALVAAALRLFGDNERAARLPSVLAAAWCAIFVQALAAHAAGRRAGFAAAVALLLGFRFFDNARASELEMLLAAACALAYLAIARRDARGGLRWVIAGALAGIVATLTKGPAIASAFPLAYAAGLAIARRSFAVLRNAALLAVIAGVTVASAAYWGPLVLGEQGDALRDRLFFRHANTHHHQPFYYYLWSLPAGFLPAALLAPAMVRKLRSLPASVRAAPSAVLLIVLGFSLAPAKQSHYMLPLDPLLAAWCGVAFAGLGGVGKRRLQGAVAAIAMVAPLVVCALDQRAAKHFALDPRGWWFAGAAAAAGLAAVGALWRARRRAAPSTCATVCAGLAVWLTLLFSDAGRAFARDAARSPRAAMLELGAAASGAPLASLDAHSAVLYYLDRLDLVVIASDAAALDFLRRHPSGHVVVESDDEKMNTPAIRALPLRASWRGPRGGWDLRGAAARVR
jgi:4-amino-4-deoxy-L-arabinose transferase-like glycosyltransferase